MLESLETCDRQITIGEGTSRSEVFKDCSIVPAVTDSGVTKTLGLIASQTVVISIEGWNAIMLRETMSMIGWEDHQLANMVFRCGISSGLAGVDRRLNRRVWHPSGSWHHQAIKLDPQAMVLSLILKEQL